MSHPIPPYLYELNTMVFLTKQGEQDHKPLPLSKLHGDFFSALRNNGFGYVWMMGMWERSPASRQVALSLAELQQEYGNAIGYWNEYDVPGSPYAVHRYQPDPRFGKWKDLKKFKERINGVGLRLILDFVPNHLALDHPWVEEFPERFISVTRSQRDVMTPQHFYKIDPDVYVAHGRDPHLEPWSDTLQLNYADPETREILIQELERIAMYCDGLRCDMAMLVVNRIFKKTWGHILTEPLPEEEFWVEAINRIKAQNPEFVFIGECYWNMEWELQQMGFDHTYDKTLYDRLVGSTAQEVLIHLKGDLDYQAHTLRFVENHDEPRALAVMSEHRARAAAVIALTVPGMKLVHDGQIEGRRVKIPVQLNRGPEEAPDLVMRYFYETLLDFIHCDSFIEGAWILCEVEPAAEDNDSHKQLLAWTWESEEEMCVVIVNFSAEAAQGRLKLPHLPDGPGPVVFDDYANGEIYDRDLREVRDEGLYVDLSAWQSHWLCCAMQPAIEISA